MADLPHSHSVYDYDGHTLTLMYSEDKAGVWEVYDGATYLGIVLQAEAGTEHGYATRLPGEEDDDRDDDSTDDWRAAVQYLVDTA
ncbi:hypothetical protein [Glaciibacter sp. 2TAF33]|uniref:hypothetical protein n=1 Tax=Glaciibacter sp. 2TAF33 TaxID=3233015 RepID=UPI003F937D3B